MSREVPSGWSLTHLGDVCEIGGGVGFSETMQGHQDLPYPFIKVSDMNDPGNEIEIQSARNYVDAQMLKEMGAKLFPAGSVVLPKVGAAALTNKRRRLAMPTAVDNNLMVWTPTSIDPSFLFHWSKTIDVASLVQTGALPSLNKAIAERIAIILPPLHEQRRIAEILFSVDEAIAATRAVIEQTRKVKQGVLERLLTKGIGHTRFKQTEIGEIPENWKVGRLDDFFVLQRGFDLPVQSRTPGNVPVIASNGEIGKHSERRVAGPAVITGRSGTLGKVFFYQMACWPLNTTLYVKDFKSNNAEFVYCFLQYFDVGRFGTGTGVPTLNRNDVHSQVVAFPLLEEQSEIVGVLRAVDEVLDAENARLQQLKEVKSALMSDLLTGRKRVTNALPMAAE